MLAFSFRCTFLCSMCLLQVSRLSRWTPRYVTSLIWGICVLFNDSKGHVCLLRVIVMCLHFCPFILIRQSDSHHSTTGRWFASCVVARPGHLKGLKIAVSSANVDVVSCSFVGIPAVYRRNRVGPSALPCGTQALIMLSSDVVVLHLTAKVLLCRYDSRNL